MIFNHPGSSTMSIETAPLPDPSLPAYCAMVEITNGTIYVGTANGVFTKNGNASWQTYDNLSGIPVTAICQQTRKSRHRKTVCLQVLKRNGRKPTRHIPLPTTPYRVSPS